MTRIFTDGAETGDTLFWDSVGMTAAASGRTGSYYYACWGASAFKNIPSLSEFYFRCGWNLTNAPAGRYPIRFRNGSNNSNILAWENTGKFRIYDGGYGLLASSSSTFPVDNSWVLLEAHLKIDDVSGIFEVKVDGLQEIYYTGDTKYSTYTEVDNILFYIGADYGIGIDDIALNDTNGTIDNSWCGDGHVTLLSPNANGDTNDWTNSAGNKTNNYTYVDEIPYTADTDYVSASVVGIQDMYNVGTFTYTNRIIKRVWANSISKDVSYSEKGIKIGYKTGGNVYLSASTVLSGAYTAVSGSVAVVNPSTGLEWTGADIDSIQFVQESA